MELREYWQLLRRWLWLILLGTIVAGAAAYLISEAQEPVYRATATLLVNEGDVATGNDFAGLQASERLAQSYVQRLSNYEVLETASANLGLAMDPEQLERNMQVSLVGNTQLIELSVEHTDPQVAQALANEIPTVFAERNSKQQLDRFASSKTSLETELQSLQQELAAAEATLAEEQEKENPDQALVDQLRSNVSRLRDTHSQLLQSYEDIRVAEAQSLNNIVIDEPARLPDAPVRPRVLTNTLLAMVVGGMLATGIVFLIEYLDNTVKSPDDVLRLTNVGTLGAVGAIGTNPTTGPIVAKEPRSPISEAYRQVRTNLQFSVVNGGLGSILVTSANQREGKTTTAANLAVTLVQMGKEVILVDSDLRRPALHKRFRLPNQDGLTTLIVEGTEDVRSLKTTDVDGLRVLTSGPLPPNPAELLGSERMKTVMAWLATQADYVVYDSPPVLVVTDSAVLSRLADATVFVVRAGQTTEQALVGAVAQIQAVDGHVAGVVLNDVAPRSGYYYYRYYQNGYYSDDGSSPAGKAKKRGRGWLPDGVLSRLRR